MLFQNILTLNHFRQDLARFVDLVLVFNFLFSFIFIQSDLSLELLSLALEFIRADLVK